MADVLFVGVFSQNSTNVAQARGFIRNGVSVAAYNYREKLNIFKTIEARDNNLISIIEKTRPKLTIFSKCNMMHERVLVAAKKVSHACLWYMDALHNMDDELSKKIEICDTFISGVRGSLKEGLKYNKNGFFVEQCPDEKYNFKIENIKRKYVATFIGNIHGDIHKERIHFLSETPINHIRGAFGHEHNEIVNQTKINFNFSPTDRAGCSVRVHKILASGGFLMSTPWDGIEKSFEVGKEIVCFETKEQMEQKMKYFLKNEKEREKIAAAGHRRVQEYMPDQWAKNILRHTIGL